MRWHSMTSVAKGGRTGLVAVYLYLDEAGKESRR